jgi:hypothetical protein
MLAFPTTGNVGLWPYARLFATNMRLTKRFVSSKLTPKPVLDLFVDVPIALGQGAKSLDQRRELKRLMKSIAERIGAYDGERDDVPHYEALESRIYRDDTQFLGAADFLLDGNTQDIVPHIVLEGAPGQGKSTITQYVCQVHRIRILKETHINKVLPHHRSCPVRLPFRIDLRDFATWLVGRDPFSAADAIERPAYWYKSLNAFVAALVRNHSGGTEFTVDDLNAVARRVCCACGPCCKRVASALYESIASLLGLRGSQLCERLNGIATEFAALRILPPIWRQFARGIRFSRCPSHHLQSSFYGGGAATRLSQPPSRLLRRVGLAEPTQ